jgi:NADPH:quinone reductase-like Zn-dependent oxidoreductase
MSQRMQAIRLKNSPDPVTPYSAANPAPATALYLDPELEIPKLTNPDELLVRMHAATVTRDELTWPETYKSAQPTPGYDFAGTVISIFAGDEADNPIKCTFSPGDEVYGMKSPEGKGCTWAEYAIVRVNEAATKPASLDWASSATVPMSALTAWQALFIKADLAEPDLSADTSARATQTNPSVKVLITGASGAVGIYLVQLGSLAGFHIAAASTSKARNEEFLKSLGADEVVEYGDLEGKHAAYDVIIDTVGGSILEGCWKLVKDQGSLITIDSSSFDFVERYQKLPFSRAKPDVKALFFIVEASGHQLEKISKAIDLKLLQTFVAQTFPISQTCEAYEAGGKRVARRGKIVLTM